MSARVTLAWDETTDGSAATGEAAVLALKSATTPEQMAALAAEAARLQQASHPGVVAFVEHRVYDDRAELRTRFAGEALGCWRGTPSGAAGLVAAVAATVADLHELGIVHGRLDLSHVLLDVDGRPRVCGWSPPADEVSAADDVAALGRLLEGLVERAAPTGGARPSWFLWPRARAADQRALAQVVAYATDPIPSRRPTARSLARAVLSAVPGAELAPIGNIPDRPPDDAPDGALVPTLAAPPTPPSSLPVAEPQPVFGAGAGAGAGAGDSTLEAFGQLLDPALGFDWPVDAVFGDQTTAEIEEIFVDRGWDEPVISPPKPGQTPHRRRHPRHLVLAVAAIGLAVALAGAHAYRAGRHSDVGAQQPVAGPPAPTAAQACAPTISPADQTTQADVDGDGCVDQIVVDGGVVEAMGQRWAVGTPGDLVTVGDWDCDGRATPAVYRPTSGDVFVFADWAGADRPVTIEATTQVPGGRSIGRAPPVAPGSASTSAGCDVLSVELDSGPYLVEVGR